MAKPENSKPGCLPSLLRVLLCAGNGTSPPVYPSDHVDETEQPVHHHPKRDKLVVGDDAITTPGVVARLMGLDSLPKNTNLVVMKGRTTTPDSVPRSRSVNFVDYLLEFDHLDNATANHRRVKTSASFREVPSSLISVQRQNRDLVLLDIDDDNNSVCKVQEGHRRAEFRKLRQGSKKSKEIVRVKEKEGNHQGKKKKNKKISKLKNEPRRVPSSSKHNTKVQNHSEAKDFSKSCNCSYRYSDAGSSYPLQNRHKKELVEPKIRNNRKNHKSPKKIETEHSLENLSPVSVLDINDYPFLYGTDFLEGTSTSSLASKSKWKSSLNGFEEKASNNKGYASTDINREAEYYSELMLKLRSLTEKDIRESEYCTSKRMCETESFFEEICLVFEHKIFDLLLYEVVNEVVELSS